LFDAQKFHFGTSQKGWLSLKNEKEIVILAVSKNIFEMNYVPDNLKEDKEIIWMSKKYFKRIRNLPTNLNFKFK
jgi:hypothetical protein